MRCLECLYIAFSRFFFLYSLRMYLMNLSQLHYSYFPFTSPALYSHFTCSCSSVCVYFLLFILFPRFLYRKHLVFCFNFDVTYLAYSSLISFFFVPKATLFLFLVQLWLFYSRFLYIFLPLLLVGTLYPRSNQDVSAGVLGYLLTVLFEKKGGVEPEFSILCLSLQSHRGQFVSCSFLTRSEVLVLEVLLVN
jgi:hypothetical protein